jgi:hypothetical protein
MLTIATWWYVAGSPSGQSCKMPATPICTDQPHKVGPEDWALAVVTVALVAGLGLSIIRSRSAAEPLDDAATSAAADN